MSVIHTPEEKPINFRQMVVPVLILAGLLGFAVRLWFLQVKMEEDLRERAVKTSLRKVKTPAPRGRIFDRNGVMVAGVQPTWVVRAVPRLATEESILRAAEILGASEKKLKKEISQAAHPSLPATVYLGATFVQASRIAESRSLLPGFDVEITAARQTLEPTLYSHVLGHVGKLTQEVKKELADEGIEGAEYVGRDGIERTHERELMGEPGQDMMVVDAKGKPLSRASQTEPVPGSRLFLTIDDGLQREAMEALSGRRGALAMISVKTGEVLAFFSAPSYSLRTFEGGISDEDYAKLLNDPAKPLIRRPTAGRYSPGSTFKIVTALAAARQGILTPGHSVHCDGGRRVGSRLVACKNHSRGMTLNFQEAFRLSCNTYFVDLALKAGPEAMRDAARDLGLGERTGIDLPSESRGFIPNAESVKEMGNIRRWYPGDTANFGIGQGDTLVTPLQMAQTAAVVSMDGVGFRPHLVRAFQGPLEANPRLISPEQTIRAEAPPGFWEMIRNAMGRVVASGTARRAQISGLEWGGKTGSTQHSRSSKTHSWFVGIAPIHNPEIAIAVLAEEAGHGGDVAAPIAARVVGKWHQLEASRKASKADSIAARSSRSS
jgi:penicillin-binding protein 2